MRNTVFDLFLYLYVVFASITMAGLIGAWATVGIQDTKLWFVIPLLVSAAFAAKMMTQREQK